MAVVTYKCPNCSGPLQFNPSGNDFTCEYCMSNFTLDVLKQHFPDLNDDLSQQQAEPQQSKADEQASANGVYDEFAQHTNLYSCPSCGAEVISDDTTAATFCHFCHNPVVISGRLSGEYCPSQVIPFKFNRDDALAAFKKWYTKKWFMPNAFHSQSQLEKISGVYFPFWLYDCDVNGRVIADAKKLRVWTTGNKTYTETSVFSVTRNADAKFCGLPADGSKKADDTLMQGLEPYNYSELTDFSMSYLSGFLAEKYDVTKEEVYPHIENRAKEYTTEMIKSTITGYNSVSIQSADFNFDNVKARYTLLPAWMLTYKYKGKTYFFAMNGQTGKVAGIPPLSVPKLFALFGIVFAASFIVTLLGGMLF